MRSPTPSTTRGGPSCIVTSATSVTGSTTTASHPSTDCSSTSEYNPIYVIKMHYIIALMADETVQYLYHEFTFHVTSLLLLYKKLYTLVTLDVSHPDISRVIKLEH